MSDDPGLTLKKYGVWLYQNLIVFAPGTDELGGDLSPEAIAEFVDAGGNVLAAGSPAAGDAIRDLAAEFGVELDDSGSYVIDHLDYDVQNDGGKVKFENLLHNPTLARLHVLFMFFNSTLSSSLILKIWLMLR